MSSDKIIYVKDYTSPSGQDSADGIREAIRAALEAEAGLIVFEAGTYRLTSVEVVQTEGMVHDAGSGHQLWK
ncbi:hypothetical protein K0U00_37880, partial [Paenibacillus sepulcri]|nr:hypothetical protein [Paenibacillus sepulcri]